MTGGYASIPQGARVLPLRAGSKEPLPGSRGHHGAIPAADFFPVENYGIALDGQWAVVDFDIEDPLREQWLAKMPATWSQRTPHGTQYLYAVPDGWLGPNVKNAKITVGTNGSTKVVGDVKVRGYIVGPGSRLGECKKHGDDCPIPPDDRIYVTLDDRTPAPAPDWLLEFVAVHGVELAPVVAERDSIEIGHNDDELYKFASYARRRGFSADAISKLVWGVIQSGILEQRPGAEYGPRDALRIARSAARHAPAAEIAGFIESDLVAGTDVQLIGAPTRWWVRGFVPRSELVTVYGKGGVGKSSMASWLAAHVTQLGGAFVFVGTEEPFERFLLRAVLMGAKRERIYSYKTASRILLPRDTAVIREQMKSLRADVLYFDSIYTHFESVQGANMASTARRCLGPLAEMAQQDGITVIGVFHENKAGEFLGSVEMQNVARYSLRASRRLNVIRLDVDKTNIWDPGYALQLVGEEVLCADPVTGDTQLEEQEDGTLQPMRMHVLRRGENIEKNTVSVAEIEVPKKRGRPAATLDDLVPPEVFGA